MTKSGSESGSGSSGFRIGARPSAQSGTALSNSVGPVLLFSSSMQLELMLQQRCLIEKTGESWRKILNTLYNPLSPSLSSPLFIVAVANYSFSL